MSDSTLPKCHAIPKKKTEQAMSIYRGFEEEVFQTHPDRTGEIREHAALESGLFALGGHALVHALAQPHVRLYVPRIDEPLEVLRNLDFPHVDVRRAVPGRGARRRVVARESEAGQDARAFGQNPHPVVLGALDKAGDLDDEDPGAYKGNDEDKNG